MKLSQQFVFDLVKSDLAYYCKQCVDGIQEARTKGWDVFDKASLKLKDHSINY